MSEYLVFEQQLFLSQKYAETTPAALKNDDFLLEIFIQILVLSMT